MILSDLQNIHIQLSDILGNCTTPPEVQEKLIGTFLAKQNYPFGLDIHVTGETDNISLYIINENEMAIFTPFIDVRENVIIKEFKLGPRISFSNDKHFAFVSHYEQIVTRLDLPKILLVNLSNINTFPVPRLSLGVSVLASYIRKKQLGRVKIIDMQMGYTKNDVIQIANQFAPHILGLSVSFGQKYLAFNLLDELNKSLDSKEVLLIAGNVIPASSPFEFLSRYPNLMIAAGEGERSIEGIIKFRNGKMKIEDVEGIIYTDHDGKMKNSVLPLLPPSEQTFPAMDTLEELVAKRGALTLELSRGCQYNVCTFCPRKHKAGKWKGLDGNEAIRQLDLIAKVMDRTGLPRRLFLADEEFVGDFPGADQKATDRVLFIANQIIDRNLNIRFDTEVRVDQIYNPDKDKEWHIQRMVMWNRLREAGLDRLFLGIESGSHTQLKRYGKGISPDQTIIALRILSSLGIGLRFGFIMFDPLMDDFKELRENVNFLDRTDAFLSSPGYLEKDYGLLFDRLIYDQDFIKKNSLNTPIYTNVSYMLASLEVLINSPYERMILKAEQKGGLELFLDKDSPDTNMGRRKVKYFNYKIGIISDKCQRWIDRNFALTYAIKSFYKTAPDTERLLLMSYMIRYREICHFLLKAMLWLVDEELNNMRGEDYRKSFGEESLELKILCKSKDNLDFHELTIKCLELFEHRLSLIVNQLSQDINDRKLTDNVDGRMKKIIHSWCEHSGQWSLINDPNLYDSDEIYQETSL